MPKIYLLRHAQSQANIDGILAGPDNSVNLTVQGFQQSKIAAKHLRKIEFTKIFSSPISRCYQTVEPLLKSRPDIGFHTHNNLSEMDYGSWNGKKLDSLAKKAEWKIIQKTPSKFIFPKGESFNQLRKRVQNFLDEIIDDPGPILVVSHGDVIKMFLACTLEQKTDNFQKFSISPSSLSIIEYGRSSKNVIATNQRISKESVARRFSKFLPGGENA